jgi:signal transduction histidine kinase
MSTLDTLPLDAEETALTESFILRRRLALIRVIARLFAGLLLVFVLAFAILIAQQLERTERATGWGAILVLLGCIALFVYASVAAQRDWRWRAILSTVAATDATIIWFLFFWAQVLGHGGDTITLLQGVSLALAIMLAGALGNVRLIIGTTLVMNGVTLALGMAYFSSVLPLFLVIGLLQQWTVAGLTLVIASNYQKTLRELGQAYARSRQLEVLKEHFITNVNHELRTPIMAMQGYLDALVQAHPTLSPEQHARFVHKAHEVGEQVIHLIESILDVRHIDETVVEHPEPVELRTICTQAFHLVDPREASLAGRELRLLLPEGLAVWGEPTRLTQVFTNLFSNAGKYSPAGSPIEVEAVLVTDEAGSGKRPRSVAGAAEHLVKITVRDYGLGIPPDQLPLLFNRFVRLPRDLASTTPGNGLGLFLCRTLLTAMHGHIWAESTGISGQGTSFQVQLPVCQAGASPERVILSLS